MTSPYPERTSAKPCLLAPAAPWPVSPDKRRNGDEHIARSDETGSRASRLRCPDEEGVPARGEALRGAPQASAGAAGPEGVAELRGVSPEEAQVRRLNAEAPA